MLDVSIIIPVYCKDAIAVEWYIQCLESALSQNCEVVVYDDASYKPLMGLDLQPHIMIASDKTQGVSHARNMAVQQCTKSLIYPLDGDDTLKPGAIERLLSFWDGETPVYSDVAKFGDENVSHYTLLEFSCEHIKNHVGFSSVNVLHSKVQWAAIGGWDEGLNFYEDGWYNAILFSKWCAKRVPEPLVNYRQHSSQRTKQYKIQSAEYARVIMERIRRLDMACKSCGGGRARPASNVSTMAARSTMAPIAANASSLPGMMDGRVLARYIGGNGKGKHYYQGPVTKFSYKVTYNQLIYADPQDVRDAGDTNMAKSSWLLIRESGMEAAKPEPAKEVVKISEPQPKVIEEVRKPVRSKTKKPV